MNSRPLGNRRNLTSVSCVAICCFLVAFRPASPPAIFSAGDSTMADTDTTGNPGRGWMQLFNAFVKPGVEIHNYGRSGRSSKSFRDEGTWKKIMDEVKKGDYVFIQFGHNDSKPDSARRTDPKTTFRENMTQFVKEARARGANPILFTSIVRRHYLADSITLKDTHGEYVTVVREIAKSLDVPLVDLNKKTGELVTRLGPEKSAQEIYIFADPNVYKKYPKGVKDNTHLRESGATAVARLAAEGIKELKLSLADYLK